MAVAGGFRTFLFRQVIVLIYAAGPRLPPWAVSRLVEIVHQSWEGHQIQCIQVARALHGALGARGFRLLLPDLLPLLLGTLKVERENHQP
ncbi:unnamed protein product, partial [Ectocarpus sp. 12 AP-2014]